ncbi:MAG TPA: holo-ACP synthase [Rhodocyclaceae bacterium]|nr:holo-ACP synthase [Rhodocyclaceae bacterium]
MIFGIGTDIVAVARIREGLEKHAERYAEHILMPAEREEFFAARDPARFLAKRFAAKEAFSKAFGTGLRTPITLHTVGVGHNELGKPHYIYTDEVVALLHESKLSAILSISDEKEYVVAVALIEQNTR